MIQRPSPKIPANSMIPGDRGRGVPVLTGKHIRISIYHSPNFILHTGGTKCPYIRKLLSAVSTLRSTARNAVPPPCATVSIATYHVRYHWPELEALPDNNEWRKP